MTILTTRALLRDALEERAALTVVSARFWQKMRLLSPPSLDSGVSVSRSRLQVLSQKSGRAEGIEPRDMFTRSTFLRPSEDSRPSASLRLCRQY